MTIGVLCCCCERQVRQLAHAMTDHIAPAIDVLPYKSFLLEQITLPVQRRLWEARRLHKVDDRHRSIRAGDSLDNFERANGPG